MVLCTPARPADRIPVIDLSGAAAQVARQIHEACRATGFFYLAGHGVPEDLVDGQFEWARRFFALSTAEKHALEMRRSPSMAGYEPIGGQSLDTDSAPDLKESYYCYFDRPDDHPYALRRVRGFGHNQWPARLPGFRAHTLGYLAALCNVGDRVLALLARSLGLADDHFAALYETPTATLRLIHYPPHPAEGTFNQLGAGAHTDWGGVTLLAQDDAGGLEVQNTAGEWIEARPIPGTFVVNLGDMMSRWTNDLYRANPHRVLNRHARPRHRYSIPLFYSPDPFARIECLPTCTSAERPPKYPPCAAVEHLDEMFRRTYGRSTARIAA